jgi:hypothetical protein
MKQLQNTALTAFSSAPQRIGTVSSDKCSPILDLCKGCAFFYVLVRFRALLADEDGFPGSAQPPAITLEVLTVCKAYVHHP